MSFCMASPFPGGRAAVDVKRITESFSVPIGRPARCHSTTTFRKIQTSAPDGRRTTGVSHAEVLDGAPDGLGGGREPIEALDEVLRAPLELPGQVHQVVE